MPQTQVQRYYRAVHVLAEMDLLFLQFVADGLTRGELQRNIDRRPSLWRRWESWLVLLPEDTEGGK